MNESLIPVEPKSMAAVQQQYRELMQLYDGAIREVRTKLEVLDAEFRVRYARNPIHHIDTRLKSPASISEKLARKGYPPTLEAAEEHLMDIAGVRIVCNYLEDIYRVAELLTHQRDVEEVRRRDYIQQPKESGYRSLHLVIRIPVFLSSHTELVPVEVQIRTIAMDFWASLEHSLRYKAQGQVPEDISDELVQTAQDIAAIDLRMQNLHDRVDALSAAAEEKHA